LDGGENINFIVSWKDDDLDDVVIASDEELDIALNEMPTGTPYKITCAVNTPVGGEVVFNVDSLRKNHLFGASMSWLM
jgi:hypothetical protein